MNRSSVVSLLTEDAVLAGVVLVDRDRLARTRRDRSGHLAPGLPLALVEPTTVEQVQRVLAIANEYSIPVVPRGAGTGLAGGAAATDGSISLSLERLDRIVEVDAVNSLAVVEAGVLNGALNERVRPLGLRFAPDPASAAISTIGGNIATNAGGLLCAKYGVTREAVLGLTVVLADGSMLTTGHRTIKGVTGYDLTALLTGSEGTLGVIVSAIVRLTPIPVGDVATILGVFATIGDAARAATEISSRRLRPAMLELLNPESVSAIRSLLGDDAFEGLPPMPAGSALLLAQSDDAHASDVAREISGVVAEFGGVASLLVDEGGSGTDAAGGSGERVALSLAERALAIRRSFNPALEAMGDVLIEDVCVPRSALADMFAEIDRISAAYGLVIPTVCHAGDGNLHPNFVVPAGAVEPLAEGESTKSADANGERDSGANVPEIVWRAADDLFRAGLALGGTLTGEHGVGVLKRRWLATELGEQQVDLQRAIKAVFDPRGILNPGKVF